MKKEIEQIMEISGADPRKCMKCGKCSASCPAYDEMDIKPHQFASYVLDGRIEELADCKSLYRCLSCFACVERCRSVPSENIGGKEECRESEFLCATAAPILPAPST